MPTTISIVEDNEQLRGTLVRLINREDGFECSSDYADAEAALAGLPNDKPNVVLMDINLPGMNGVECVRRLKQSLPDVQVVMLTAYEDTENIFNALAAGASGYLLKTPPAQKIVDSIFEVHNGGAPMTPQVARSVLDMFSRLPSPSEDYGLTERELFWITEEYRKRRGQVEAKRLTDVKLVRFLLEVENEEQFLLNRKRALELQRSLDVAPEPPAPAMASTEPQLPALSESDDDPDDLNIDMGDVELEDLDTY